MKLEEVNALNRKKLQILEKIMIFSPNSANFYHTDHQSISNWGFLRSGNRFQVFTERFGGKYLRKSTMRQEKETFFTRFFSNEIPMEQNCLKRLF